MKKYSLYLVGIFVSTLATMLLSWNRFNYSNKGLTPSLKSYFYDQDYSDLTETELSAFDADDKDEYFSPDREDDRPRAEDVLVQKIPGDDYYLLMMAFYSRENYSKSTFTINEDGAEITFRDDGK